jgi:hypothetical protein
MKLQHYTDISLKHAIRTASCTLIGAFCLLACGDNSPTTSGTQPRAAEGTATTTTGLDGLLNSVQASLDSASSKVQQAVQPHANELQIKTKEQVEKLHQWEYLVEEVPLAAGSAGSLEARLQALGQQRWDCFNIQTQGALLQVACKRRPATALSYLKCLSGL